MYIKNLCLKKDFLLVQQLYAKGGRRSRRRTSHRKMLIKCTLKNF